jgi:hypothetical protein
MVGCLEGVEGNGTMQNEATLPIIMNAKYQT